VITRLLARFRRPSHVSRFGDYTGDLTFLTCWAPTDYEIR
jgi:hypothetical protein